MNRFGISKPRSLVRHVSDLIRDRIAKGQLGPVLPGEEEIARLFDVYILDPDKLCRAVVNLVLRVARAGKPMAAAAMIPMFLVPGRSIGSVHKQVSPPVSFVARLKEFGVLDNPYNTSVVSAQSACANRQPVQSKPQNQFIETS